MRSVRVHYEGRVQGVGFRWTVRRLAKEFEVTGTVRNLPDGRVELVAQGADGEVTAFLDSVRKSELAGHISGEVLDELAGHPALRNFQIIE